MEHLGSAWSNISSRLKDASRVLLLMDYDGTLTPIVERPELANLAEETRHLLEALTHQPDFTVAIISGRALVDLKNKVNLNGLVYVGNHGLEIEGPEISFVSPVGEETKTKLRTINYVLSRALGAIKGVLIESKGLSLSVHYRQVAESEIEEVKGILEHIVGGLRAAGKVRIAAGKKVYEIRPVVDWDKGKVVKLLIKKCFKGARRSGLLPIYFGDDLADEEAFKVIEDYGQGISVFVGEAKQNTAARYFVESPTEVIGFLGRLLNLKQGVAGES